VINRHFLLIITDCGLDERGAPDITFFARICEIWLTNFYSRVRSEVEAEAEVSVSAELIFIPSTIRDINLVGGLS